MNIAKNNWTYVTMNMIHLVMCLQLIRYNGWYSTIGLWNKVRYEIISRYFHQSTVLSHVSLYGTMTLCLSYHIPHSLEVWLHFHFDVGCFLPVTMDPWCHCIVETFAPAIFHPPYIVPTTIDDPLSTTLLMCILNDVRNMPKIGIRGIFIRHLVKSSHQSCNG